jgi:hypothetical protein
MSSKKRKSRTAQPARAKGAAWNSRRRLLVLGSGVAAVVALVLLFQGPLRDVVRAPLALWGAPSPSFQPLVGRWTRLDGGYVLEVGQVDAAGAVTAAYFNPRPINVAGARAGIVDGTVRLAVEFQDRGYPGSTYTLAYDARTDQLRGTYFQAVQGQSYDVTFFRMK